MNKATIRTALQRAAEGAEFITRPQLMTALHCGRDKANSLVKELDFVQVGGTTSPKLYIIEDVVMKLLEHKTGGTHEKVQN